MRLSVLFLMTSLVFSQQSYASLKTVYGYIEDATLVEQKLDLHAKLDTGAKSSSLHAVQIKRVSINGKRYVRFMVPYHGKLTPFLCPYLGKVSIKPRTQEIEHIERPLVLMKIKLGDRVEDIRVNLTNRANFLYPLLLGRQAIVAFGGIVDPNKRYETRMKHTKPTDVQ